MAKQNSDKAFGEILIESIDQAFMTLGENSRTAIYKTLESKFGLPRQDIPNRVADFSNALEQVFGVAARQLEILIMKCLNAKVACSYKWAGPKWLVPNVTFTEYVRLAKLSFDDNRRIGEVEVVLDAEQEQRS